MSVLIEFGELDDLITSVREEVKETGHLIVRVDSKQISRISGGVTFATRTAVIVQAITHQQHILSCALYLPVAKLSRLPDQERYTVICNMVGYVEEAVSTYLHQQITALTILKGIIHLEKNEPLAGSWHGLPHNWWQSFFGVPA